MTRLSILCILWTTKKGVIQMITRLTIEIEDDLKREIKSKASIDGLSMKDLIVKLF